MQKCAVDEKLSQAENSALAMLQELVSKDLSDTVVSIEMKERLNQLLKNLLKDAFLLNRKCIVSFFVVNPILICVLLLRK